MMSTNEVIMLNSIIKESGLNVVIHIDSSRASFGVFGVKLFNPIPKPEHEPFINVFVDGPYEKELAFFQEIDRAGIEEIEDPTNAKHPLEYQQGKRIEFRYKETKKHR